MSGQTGKRLAAWAISLLCAGCVIVGILLSVSGCLSEDMGDSDVGRDSGRSEKEGIMGAAADNSKCLLCHADFKAELISAGHEKAGVGCTKCHGLSLAHGGDELNITPPDKLFGRAEIAGFCKDCHPTHKKGQVYEDFVKKWHSKRRPNGRMVLDDSVCTDCHGEHAVLRPDQQEMIFQ